MDLIGHLKVIEDAGLGSSEYLQGDEILYAMFPNLAHCHEWAYKSLWDIHHTSDDVGLRLIQGHMICDYVIHYGPTLAEPKERIGWAYKEMPKALEVLDQFFNHVTENGFVTTDPRLLDTPEHMRRDFGHTAVECALDFALANDFNCGNDRIPLIREAFEKISLPENGEKFVNEVFQKTNGYTREPRELIRNTIANYGKWVQTAETPVEFASLTLLSKYNIEITKESQLFCLEFLDNLSNRLDSTLLNQMISEIVERIINPDLAILDLKA
ncbi:TPA: hypothetical protein QCY03_003489 [Bacillus tropicus]|nr:hypothetical protein [Bacillus tropicus]